MSSSPARLSTAPAPPLGLPPPESGALAHPLLPGLSPRTRTDGTLQLGPDPVHGVVLTGLGPHEAGPVTRLLALLADVSDPVRSETLAGATGLPQTRVVEIVLALEEAGLTHRHPTGPGRGDLSAWSLSRRRHGGEASLLVGSPLPLKERREGARVVVDGRGAVVEDVARLLQAAHVGEVRCGWYAGAGVDLDDRSPDPSLVITVGTRLPRLRAADWLHRSIAHLPVIARIGSVDIGPLVVPGAGPCLTCIRLHEGTTLLADLGRDDLLADAQNDPTRVEPSLAGITAGTVAMLALGLIDAYPPPLGMRWHSALPLPSLATSRWEIHPQCDAAAHRRPRAPATRQPPVRGRMRGKQGGRL